MEEDKKQIQNNKIVDHFCNLHCHSTYSFTDAVGSPEQYAERAKELGQPAIGITDHGNVSAHYKWYTECKKRDVKPVLGCELYIVEREDQIRVPTYYHITVLVLNKIGYRNLMQLVTKGWCEQFYYKPKVTFQDLIDCQEGLAILSGCLSGPILQELHKGSEKKAKQNFDYLSKNIKNFYIEMQPIDFDGGLQAYQKFIKMSKNYPDVPWIVTSDCHCVIKEHLKTQEIMLCVQSKSLWNDPDRWKFDQKDLYLKSRKEMEDGMNRIFPDVKWKEALDNTIKLADKVDFEFPSATPIKFPVPEEEKIPLLKRMCKDGLKERGLEKPEYIERMKYELDIIIKKNFIDYFLVVADIVKWAKNNNILVGPARGSAAGSLVCYLAEITEVDPIEYSLIFERFIDLNREDMPDIDVDFEDIRRNEIKQYIEDKYGAGKVGTLPTFATFKGKSAIDDIGRIFKIPFKETDRLKGMIIERSGGDSRASFTIEDTFESFPAAKKIVDANPDLKQAALMEGQIRQMGKHAAGMIVSNEPLINFCAVYKVKDQFVTSLDYKDASSIGLLKLDLLGLNTLTVVHKTVDLIKERHNKDIEVYKLPLDDKKTYKSFRDGKLFGVFQFDGQAVNQICRQIKPNDFESLSAISALGRPGPLNGGSTTEYIMRRSGKEKIVYPHEIMKDYTEETYGVVIYQEQVMKTMRNIGKMSWKDTAEIRMLISKSQGVEKFNQYKKTFAIGAKENGMDNKQIDDMWDAICTFGSWAFNKSHSVSYTLISYWTMWLKVHYPMEFYSSILSLTLQEEKQKKIIKEYKREGYKVFPVDINKSKKHFVIDGDGIRIGFADVKGIGDKSSEIIVRNQPYVSYEQYVGKNKRKFNMSHLDGMSKIDQLLINLGAFDSIPQSNMIDLFGNKAVWYSKKNIPFAERWNACPWDVEFNIVDEWLPILKKYPKTFKTVPTPIENLSGKEGKEFVIWGIVYDKNLKDVVEEAMSRGKKPPQLKNGLSKFCNFILEDDSDFITIRVSPHYFPKFKELLFERLREDDVIIMKGKMGSGIRMFFANQMVCLREFDDKNSNENDSKIKTLEPSS